MSRKAIGNRAAQIARQTSVMTRHGCATALGASARSFGPSDGAESSRGRVEVVFSRGGNSDVGSRNRACDLRQQHLGAEPRVDRVLAVVGQLVQTGNRLVPLDAQLHLPA